MEGVGRTRIRLCGRLAVVVGATDLAPRLPGRQGRLVTAYLADNRARPVTRDELVELVWPHAPPGDPQEALSALLSKVRRVLGADVLVGRATLGLALPDDVSIDVEDATGAVREAEAALADGRARAALAEGRRAAGLLAAGFLVGLEAPWVTARRHELEELHLRALETAAVAGLRLGGAELAEAQHTARALVDAAPFRESGHRTLMETLAAAGNVAEALQVFEALRRRLRDALGTSPGPAISDLHRLLLQARPPAPRRGRDERKLVTVLALRLETGEDPEEDRRRGRRVEPELRRHGGEPAGLSGDVLLAVFGAPATHEDDAARALAAAHGLCTARLAVAAGVATGEALVEGDRLRGLVVGRAERLARGARRGTTATDAATRRGAARAAAPRSVFVGRAYELDALGALHRAVCEERRPRLVTIAGPAGVGKSRLVAEFLARLDRIAPLTVRRGRCPPYGEGITYWPLREILWESARIRLDDPAALAAAKLRRCVEGVLAGAPDSEQIASALAAGAGITLPDDPLSGQSPDAVAAQLRFAWPRVLSGLAARGPAIIVVEDLHWARRPLIEMLESVALSAGGPLLVIATARPEFDDPACTAPAGAATSLLALEPLPPAHALELARLLLPGAEGGRREAVARASEGNPLFAEELARAPAPPEEALPQGIRGLLSARIDALPPDCKDALQDAAVIGRSFWASMLARIGAEIPAPTLAELERRGLVVRAPPSPLIPDEPVHQFRHGLIREVAYQAIPRGRRCRLHAAVARGLRDTVGDRWEEFADLLAHHYEAAAAPEDAELAWGQGSPEPAALRADAVALLLSAGDTARRRRDLAAAERFAERAARLAAGDHERLSVLTLRAATRRAALAGDDALADYRAAIDLAERLGEDALARRLRAQAVLLSVRYAGAFASDGWKRHALALIDALGRDELEDGSYERGALLVGEAMLRMRGVRRGPGAAARRQAERAVAIAERAGDGDLLATALEALTWLALEEQGHWDAEALGLRLRAAADALPDPFEAHESRTVAAMCLAWAGRFDAAADLSRDVVREGARLGAHRSLHGAAAAAVCLIPSGRFEELRTLTDEVGELARNEGQRLCQTAALAVAGRALVLHEAGEDEAAAALLALIEDLAFVERPSTYPYIAAELLWRLVPAARTRTLLDSAGRHRGAGVRLVCLRVQLPLAAFSEPPAQVRALVAEAAELAQRAAAPSLTWIAQWAEAVLLARAGHSAQAVRQGRKAMRELTGYGERYTAARLLLDLLLFTRTPADEVAGDLAAMGARASASEAQAARPRVTPR
jgi:DNA-binding SARP family transcriptional activator